MTLLPYENPGEGAVPRTLLFQAFPGTSGSSGRSPAWRLGPFSLSPQRVLSLVLSILLIATFLESWMAPLPAAHASSTLPSPPASMTFQQFLKEGRHDKVYHGPLIRPQQIPSLPGSTHGHFTNYATLPPSAEPAHMKPITQPLTTTFLQGSAGVTPLDLLGSDGRMEVQIQPGTFDLSHAAVTGGHALVGSVSLRLSQVSGHFVGFLNLLGTYQLQLVDSQGNVVSGIRLRTPITYIYHYQPGELSALGLDPAHILMSWPSLIQAAEHAHQPTTGLVIPLHNDPAAHTLTGQSSVIDSQAYSLAGDPTNQTPPTLHLASVQGNAGQLTYSYPLQVPPGTGGFAPQLALNYSSSDPNERHSPTAPANNAGDGWTLSLGTIGTEVYPDGTTWYFLSGVANAGDRLIYNSITSLYDTQHISRLRIQQANPGTATTCFHIWDKAGTYYELGCTADSLQYWTDGNGNRHNYRWDVNKIVAPNEGSSSGTYKMILATYVQDSVTSSGHTTIRDAAIEQITYGVTGNPNTALSSITGTVDFHYYAPTAHPPFADAYPSTNYNCTGTPPDGTSTTWRCDDPIQKSGGFTAPTVFSTLSLQWVTSYVSDDSSSSRKDVRYDFTYSDTPYQNCTDPLTLTPGYCAGEHVLMSITPTVYQSGTAHQLKGVVYGYTTPQQNTYFDSIQTVGGQPYQVTTSWKYLNSYRDTNTGVGAQITYARAYNNTDGTPTVKSGTTVTDDRYDALYCSNYPSDCSTSSYSGHYAHPDDHAWSVQVVTQIQAQSLDSSSSSLRPAITLYSYRLAKTGSYSGSGTWCYPDQYNQNNDCVGDSWIPASDTDWQDYYHAEYHGFYQVYITSPANDLTIDSYYSTEGWYKPYSDGANFLGGAL